MRINPFEWCVQQEEVKTNLLVVITWICIHYCLAMTFVNGVSPSNHFFLSTGLKSKTLFKESKPSSTRTKVMLIQKH